ncbi:MAG: EI24 domain-containing protein [Victivallaceae bacterium]|nr:EI24 domain-containing protein [Victivallaceae bacterium]
MILNWVKQFFIGVMLIFRGMGLFIRRPRCWSYLTVPVIINIALYGAGIWLMFVYIWPWVMGWLPMPPAEWWNQLWSIPLEILTSVVLILIVALVFIFTFTMAFFVIAAPFLDRLTLFIEREDYNSQFKIESKSHFVVYCWSSLKRSLKIWLMMLLWSIILLPLGWLVPAVGMIPFVLVISYYFALSFLVYSAEHYQLSSQQFRTLIKGKRMIIFGFGLVAYFALLIPFLAIPMLPIMVISGVILFNEHLLPKPM